MIQLINLFISKFQSGNRVRLALELLIRIIFQLSKGKKKIYTHVLEIVIQFLNVAENLCKSLHGSLETGRWK